jgi:hypothetical protein
MDKEKCDCGKIAVWWYMPGYSGKGNPYHCDGCISSPENIGCSCNFRYTKDTEHGEQPEGIEGKDWRWVIHEGDNYWRKMTKEDGIWQKLDDRGRPRPCAEYDYSKNGYDIPTWWNILKVNLIFKWWGIKISVKEWWERHISAEVPPDQEI